MLARNAVLLVAVSAALIAKSYPVEGIVIAVDRAARTMLVSHRPIGAYMPAMTMPFAVENPDQLNGLHAGMRVRFDLAAGKGRALARNVRQSGGEDVAIPPPKERLRIGDAIPDFMLTDQLGRPSNILQFRRKVLAVNFIYTRCPLPDICPRLSANFAALQKHFSGSMSRDLVLLSITVDPDYDTPAVLAEYAARWGADARWWRFLTGDVSRIAPQLGEVYWTDEGSIGHNSVVSIVGRDGRLAALMDGSTWRIGELEDLISHQLEDAK
jgi:protein SCO1/2